MKQDFIQKHPLTNKKKSLAHILSYAIFLTYVHVSKVFLVSVYSNFNRFAVEDEQISKLVSVHPSNSQTWNQQRKLLLLSSRLLDLIFGVYVNGYMAEGNTELDIHVL